MLNYRPKHVWFQIEETECCSLWLVRGETPLIWTYILFSYFTFGLLQSYGGDFENWSKPWGCLETLEDDLTLSLVLVGEQFCDVQSNGRVGFSSLNSCGETVGFPNLFLISSSSIEEQLSKICCNDILSLDIKKFNRTI